MPDVDASPVDQTPSPSPDWRAAAYPAEPIARPEHLAPEAAEALGLDREDRIAFARTDCWIPYPRAREAVRTATDLMKQPRATEAERPLVDQEVKSGVRKKRQQRGMLIVGRAGNGKSTILDRIAGGNLPFVRTGGSTTAPVIAMELSPGSHQQTVFYGDLLEACGSVHKLRDHWLEKRKAAISMIVTLRPRLLVIDEVHNIQRGTGAAQREILTNLKWMSNTFDLPMVLAGTEEADDLMRNDPQLTRRFPVFALERWKKHADLPGLLDSFESILPLPERSFLSHDDMSRRIDELYDGTIGSLSWVLRQGAVDAIRRGRPRIDLEILSRIRPDTDEERKRQLALV